ncbi:methyltransferase domain-containing protein [Terrihabitans sp. B22-R8]|uniref:methyltransferase domain-containing protein n=1 Tax=Terrihabitans sp. B22-R8 TaxID=3425128 RepID=UPI00403D0F95
MTMPRLFDHALRLKRRLRAGPDDVLLPRLADEMAVRLGAVLRDFPLAVDFDTPGPDIAEALNLLPNVGHVIRAGSSGPADIIAGHDALPFRDRSLDLVVSAQSLHWAEDLPGTLVQIRRALKPDGLFLGALTGGDTLTELRQAFTEAEADTAGGVSPRVIPFGDVRDLGGLLQRAGFALPVVDSERLTVRYGDLYDLFRDLRGLGVTNPMLARARTPLRRETLLRVNEIYRERFADPDGRLRVTVEIVWMLGWAPHESQQKPMRPGSARQRLAEALGSVEVSTGVKPNE